MTRTSRFSSLALCLGAGSLFGACAPGTPSPVGDAAQSLSQSLGGEAEPNDTANVANPIGLDTVVRGNIFPSATDSDFYTFSANAGDKLYVATMTSFSAGPLDSFLEVYASDGVTLLEGDDDNGQMGTLSSSIAGLTLPQAGTYYVRARSANNASVRPYDLHMRLQSGQAVPEVEPNNMTAMALPANGWVSGTIGAGDIDAYSIQLGAGDTIFASLDLDPTRDGTEWNGSLQFGSFGPANNSIRVDDAGNTGPDSEALFATVKTAKTYYIGVLPGTTGTLTGDYTLSVSVHKAATPKGKCTTYMSADSSFTIPAGPGLVSSTVVVPGSPRIADLDVSLKLTHNLPQDLDIVLRSPAGNEVGLVADNGSGTAGVLTDWDLTFDDEAAYPVSVFNLLSGLVVQPKRDYRLDWFKGENAGGTWTLDIRDDQADNGGTLQGWGLTICEPPPAATCAGGILPTAVFQTDFEAGAANFLHSGTQDEWEIGTPSAAPFTNCNSGTKCFKTDLLGTYNAQSDQNLISPQIDLTSWKPPISLRWAMKYQMETALSDRAWVDVREAGQFKTTRLWEWRAGTMTTDVGNPAVTVQESAGWGEHTADLSAFAGKKVEVIFHLDSNASVELGGLAIDDVSVTACPEICGDAMIGGMEVCDDGNKTNGDGCDSNCTATACGNGILTMGEACDDGNLVDGDGCDSNCTIPGCGNGTMAGGEACDDGNLVDGDGCDSNCTKTGCGNGIVTTGETCDDGNTMNGDGCAADCTTEGAGGSGGGSGGAGGGGGGSGGAGGSGGGGGGGGGSGGGSGGGGGGGGAGGSGGAGGTGGTGGSGGTGGLQVNPVNEGSCDCSVPGGTTSNGSSALAGLGLIALLATRLRRRR